MNQSISDERLIALSEAFGTPLYVYDASVIRNQYQKLTAAFKGANVRLFYAAKALSNIHILRLIKQLGAGLDTVSIEEIQLGLLAGFLPAEILFTPNGISFSELEEAIALGVGINIDNISLLEKFGNRYGDQIPVCLRVNPHILGGGNYKIATGHIDSKFGISIHQMRHAQRLAKLLNIRVEGLHMHTGSDILDADVFLKGADLLFDLAHDFPELQYLDFGSGFKVAYQENDIVTDITLLGTKMATRYEKFCNTFGRPIQLRFEPGKFLVSESGYFLAKTNVIKPTTSTVFAGVDTGFNHLVRPMFYEAHHHISNLSNPKGQPRIYTIVGYVCETDTFGLDRRLPEVREGDLLCFHNAGAYGFMMASNYNSRLRPAEVLVDQEQYSLIRRRETLADLLRTQVLDDQEDMVQMTGSSFALASSPSLS